MNIITGAKGFPTKAFLRAMDGHIFRFHGEEYDLQALRSEVDKIAQLLDSGDKKTPTFHFSALLSVLESLSVYYWTVLVL
jgi:hypothetical protein